MASLVLVVFQTRDNLLSIQGAVNLVLLFGLFGTLRTNRIACTLAVSLLIAGTVFLEVNERTGWHFSWLVSLEVFLNTLLYLILAIAVLRIVLHRPLITLESVNGALAAYILLVLIYGRLYGILEYLIPGSFHFETAPSTSIHMPPYPDLVYFSMTALTTVGFGDIAPVSSSARALCMTETITGQLYLAVFVARLVGIHIAMQTTSATKTDNEITPGT